jgi:PHD/YefM family antitoxin component YafN of YafNO toxin-antitoxin module
MPEVLSIRDFRARLAATVARVTGTGSPVFVGGYRKPEVDVMSLEQYESLVGAARRREAVAEALASVRAEGLEPSVEGPELLEQIANGQLDEDRAIETLRGRYQR